MGRVEEAWSGSAQGLGSIQRLEADIEDGRDYYAARSISVAERFLREVDAALALVREAPERWAIYRLGMRRYVMATFPYSIYRHGDRGLEVYAVAHAKRRPLYWRKRSF